MTDDDDKLKFKRAPGGYVAENHHRFYVVYSGWGWREDLQKDGFTWTLEVREKFDVAGQRTVVGRRPIHLFEGFTMRTAVAEAHRLEADIAAALQEASTQPTRRE